MPDALPRQSRGCFFDYIISSKLREAELSAQVSRLTNATASIKEQLKAALNLNGNSLPMFGW